MGIEEISELALISDEKEQDRIWKKLSMDDRVRGVEKRIADRIWKRYMFSKDEVVYVLGKKLGSGADANVYAVAVFSEETVRVLAMKMFRMKGNFDGYVEWHSEGQNFAKIQQKWKNSRSDTVSASNPPSVTFSQQEARKGMLLLSENNKDMLIHEGTRYRYAILMEPLAEGDAEAFLKRSDNVLEIVQVLNGIVEAIDGLASIGFLNSDIKLENLLVVRTGDTIQTINSDLVSMDTQRWDNFGYNVESAKRHTLQKAIELTKKILRQPFLNGEVQSKVPLVAEMLSEVIVRLNRL